jgi:hypothetical protein
MLNILYLPEASASPRESLANVFLFSWNSSIIFSIYSSNPPRTVVTRYQTTMQLGNNSTAMDSSSFRSRRNETALVLYKISARAKVCHTVKLMEKILEHLCVHDILNAKLISKQTREIILTSPTILRALLITRVSIPEGKAPRGVCPELEAILAGFAVPYWITMGFHGKVFTYAPYPRGMPHLTYKINLAGRPAMPMPRLTPAQRCMQILPSNAPTRFTIEHTDPRTWDAFSFTVKGCSLRDLFAFVEEKFTILRWIKPEDMTRVDHGEGIWSTTLQVPGGWKKALRVSEREEEFLVEGGSIEVVRTPMWF